MSNTASTPAMGLPPIEVAGESFRLNFTRRGDRLSHAILHQDGDGNTHAILQSVEGTSAEDWPASSALQNLSVEELTPGQPVALLVGMAGKSHWSASVERLHEGNGWLWDMACRVSAFPQFLGSTYQVSKGSIEGGRFAFSVPGTSQRFALLVTPIAIAGKSPAQATCCELTTEETQFRLSACTLPITGPTTFRWKYRVEVLAS